MASAAVSWFGDTMSAVPLRNNKAAASAVRAISVLGATGSIGDSTMDLLRASPERYRVEALTANTNVAGLAKLAKEFNARFAAVADASLLGELRAALAGTGILSCRGISMVSMKRRHRENGMEETLIFRVKRDFGNDGLP